MPACLVYMTAADLDEAERIGRDLVTDRLAACVNILGPIRALFWWQGAVQTETEIALLAKTDQDRLEALTARVQAIHSYDTPCVIALPIEGGAADFLSWITASTRPDPAAGPPGEGGAIAVSQDRPPPGAS